jgi:hypothetical protein
MAAMVVRGDEPVRARVRSDAAWAACAFGGVVCCSPGDSVPRPCASGSHASELHARASSELPKYAFHAKARAKEIHVSRHVSASRNP